MRIYLVKSKLSEVETDKLYDRYRKKIEHEDILINQRIVWMITLQGLLFTAYGFSLGAQANALTLIGQKDKVAIDFLGTVNILRDGMIFVGAASSFVALLGVIAAVRAILHDEQAIKDLDSDAKPIGENWTSFLGALCGLLIPVLSGCVWVWIGCHDKDDPWIVGRGGIICAIITVILVFRPKLSKWVKSTVTDTWLNTDLLVLITKLYNFIIKKRNAQSTESTTQKFNTIGENLLVALFYLLIPVLSGCVLVWIRFNTTDILLSDKLLSFVCGGVISAVFIVLLVFRPEVCKCVKSIPFIKRFFNNKGQNTKSATQNFTTSRRKNSFNAKKRKINTCQ